MTKIIEIHYTEETEHCGLCFHCRDKTLDNYFCDENKRKLARKNLWGAIPKWCKLPDKGEE